MNNVSHIVGRRHRFRIVIPAFPAFNIYSRFARRMTALGPVYIGSLVNKMPGWDVEIIDENNYRRHGPRTPDHMPDHDILQDLRPADVVGFYGGLTSTIPRLYELANHYKKRGVITLAGGQHFAGENIAEGLAHDLDVIVRGEAEDTISECLPALVEKRDLSQIAGLAFLANGQVTCTPDRPPPEEFDQYPIPDFSLLRYAKLEVFPVGRVRGCGMDCEFCTVKGRARRASPERLMEQIMSAAERWNAKSFFVVDDLFGQDREETLRFCRLLREYETRIRRSFFMTAQIRLDKAHDPVLLDAMRKAGFRAVAIGFESPVPEELTAMRKHLKPEEMIELTRRFHAHGFLVHGMFIFGYPIPEGVEFRMSAADRLRHFRRFIRKAKIDTFQLLLPIPLPGTELTARLKQAGRVFPLDLVGWEYYDGNFPLFVPDPPLTPRHLLQSVHTLMGFFYRFRYMFVVGASVLSFPFILLYLHDLEAGWRLWYREWRNSVIRFGGWITMRHWMSDFKKDSFIAKLEESEAKLCLRASRSETALREAPGLNPVPHARP